MHFERLLYLQAKHRFAELMNELYSIVSENAYSEDKDIRLMKKACLFDWMVYPAWSETSRENLERYKVALESILGLYKQFKRRNVGIDIFSLFETRIEGILREIKNIQRSAIMGYVVKGGHRLLDIERELKGLYEIIGFYVEKFEHLPENKAEQAVNKKEHKAGAHKTGARKSGLRPESSFSSQQDTITSLTPTVVSLGGGL